MNSRPSSDFSKISLNYDQIDAKLGNTLVEQCRGLIIRPLRQLSKANWDTAPIGQAEVVAWGMNRFYNYGDSHSQKLDFSCTTVYEKLDGTMIMYYWDEVKDSWCVATRSVPEADIEINDIVHTFESLFHQACEFMLADKTGDHNFWDPEAWDNALDKNVTYVFELTTPHNQVIVYYPNHTVTLLSRRCIKTGLELPVHSNLIPYVEVPKCWPMPNNLDELIQFIDAADPKALEGAVLCDANFNRIKIKNKSYVLANKAKDHVCSSKRNALEIIIRGKADDIVPILDDRTAKFLSDLQTSVGLLFQEFDQLYHETISSTTSRKDFSLALKNSNKRWMSGPIFAMYDKKFQSSSEYFQDLANKNKLIDSTLDHILSLV